MPSNNSRSPSRNTLELALDEVLGNAPTPWVNDDLEQQLPLPDYSRSPQPYMGQLGTSGAEQLDRPFWRHDAEMYATLPFCDCQVLTLHFSSTAFDDPPAPDYGLQLPSTNNHPPDQPLRPLPNPQPTYHHEQFGPVSDATLCVYLCMLPFHVLMHPLELASTITVVHCWTHSFLYLALMVPFLLFLAPISL